MSPSLRASSSGSFVDVVNEQLDIMAAVVTGGVAAATNGAKLELNQGTQSALGRQLWEAKVYPTRGASLRAAGAIKPRRGAGNLIEAFSEATVINARNGKFLAIPTENVPRVIGGGRGGRKRMTPAQVEDNFNQDLHLVKSLRPGTWLLVLNAVVRGKRPGTLRRATRRRKAQGRQQETVIMFVLVRQVKAPKLLQDPAAVIQRWADQVPALMDRATPGD